MKTFVTSLLLAGALVDLSVQQDDCMALFNAPDACSNSPALDRSADSYVDFCANTDCIDAIADAASQIETVCTNVDPLSVTQVQTNFLTITSRCATDPDGNLCINRQEQAYQDAGFDIFTAGFVLDQLDQAFLCETCGYELLEVERVRQGDSDVLADVEAYVQDNCPDGPTDATDSDDSDDDDGDLSDVETGQNGATSRKGMDLILSVALLFAFMQ